MQYLHLLYSVLLILLYDVLENVILGEPLVCLANYTHLVPQSLQKYVAKSFHVKVTGQDEKWEFSGF